MFFVVRRQSMAALSWTMFFACLITFAPLCAEARSNLCNLQKEARKIAVHAIDLSHAGRFAEATIEFDKAIAIAPLDEELLISKAYTIYGGINDCAKANLLYSKALKINPLNTDALALRGISIERMNLSHHALLDFNRAIEISPNDDRLYSCRGLFYRLQHRYVEALRDYDKAISLKPHDPFYLNERAYTKVWLGLNKQGLNDINEAIALNPKEASFYYTRGILLGELRRFEESIKDYTKAESLGYLQMHCARADISMAAGHYREALADWQYEADHYPEDLGFFLAKRGQCFMKLQDWKSALVELNRAEAKHGEHPFVFQWRAEVFDQMGRHESALKDFSYALTFFEAPMQQDCSQRIQILLERAKTFEKLSRFDSACCDLISVSKVAPFNREMYCEFLSLSQSVVTNNSWMTTFTLEVLISLFIHRVLRRRRIRRLF